MGSGASQASTVSQPFIFMPEQSSPPIPAAGTANAAAFYTDGTDVFLSIGGNPYAAIPSGPVTVTLDAAYQGGNQINLTQALGAVILSSARTSGNVLQIASTAVTLTSTLVGISVDLSAVNGGLTNAAVGLSITGASSTVAKGTTAATANGLFVLKSRYQKASALQTFVRNTNAVAGSLWFLGWDSTNFAGTPATSSVLDGVTHMVTLDGQTNVTAGAQEFVNLRILVPGSSSASTRGIVVSSLQTAGVLASFEAGAATLSASLIGLNVDLSALTAGNQTLFGVSVTLPVGGNSSNTSRGFTVSRSGTLTASGNWLGSGVYIENAPTNSAGTASESGSLLYVGHAPVIGGGAITDTTKGIEIVMMPASAAAVTGIYVTMAANTSASASAVVVDSSLTAGTILKLNSACETGTNVLVGHNGTTTTTGNQYYLRVSPLATGGTLTLGAGLIGVSVEFGASVTFGANTVEAFSCQMPAAGSSGATAAKGYTYSRSGTLATGCNFTGSAFLVANAPARASGAATENGVLVSVTHAPTTGGGGALTDTTTGVGVTMTPFSSSAVNGVLVTMGSNTSASGACIKLTMSGAGACILFSSADSGVGHLLGPTNASLTMKAGTPTSSANGNSVVLYGSNALTSGTGGTVQLIGGDGAGGTNAGGGIILTGGAPVSTGAYGYVQAITAVAENSVAVSYTAGGTTTINVSQCNAFTATAATNSTTWAFSNPPTSGYYASFTLILTNGGSQTQNWPAGTKWPGGVAPTLTSAGVDVLVFFTIDAGTTWRGVLAQANSS